MHNKVMIADARAAIVGGRNLADESFGLHPGANFRDLGLLALGPIVGQLSQLFDRYWSSPWTFPADKVVGTPTAGKGLDHLRTRLDQRARVGTVESALVAQLDQADTELVLVSAYLVPTAELADALRRAEARGVQVRIRTNSLLFDEDLSFVGSANRDPRSLNINTEMGLLVRSRELSRQIRDAFGVDFERRNAWHLEETSGGHVRWVGDDQVLSEQPAESPLQRIEDWFFSTLPIRDTM
jgi:phosphatidylserine/phosphatidylglycerophosphate/cardiolipin synthase-like enzyme